MKRAALFFLALMTVLASPSMATDDDAWAREDACAAKPAFGRGHFNVAKRYKADRTEFKVTSCPGAPAFEKIVNVSARGNTAHFYAIPFYDAKHLDFLVEVWFDDGFHIELLSGRTGYQVEITADLLNPPTFSDGDSDGVWDVNLFAVQKFNCVRGPAKRSIGEMTFETQIVTRDTCGD